MRRGGYLPHMFARLIREVRAVDPRYAWGELVRCFKENDLLTYASAFAFRVFFALVPLLLLGLGLLGGFGLTEVWSSDVAPKLRDSTSPAAFEVLDDTVKRVLASKQGFWITAGALIAIWEVSGALRATTQVLTRIYDSEEDRSWTHRMALSVGLAALVTVLLLAAAASPRGLGALLGGGALARLAGWAVAVVLMFAAVGLILRVAPKIERPLRWVSFGSVLVIAGWIGAALLYGTYVTRVADYNSIFGSLAVVMVTLGFIYMQSIVFLTGLQLDGLIRRRVHDDEDGDRPGGREQSPIVVARSVASAQDQIRRGPDGAGVARDEQHGHDRLAPGV